LEAIDLAAGKLDDLPYVNDKLTNIINQLAGIVNDLGDIASHMTT
jgi:hypothetical protein